MVGVHSGEGAEGVQVFGLAINGVPRSDLVGYVSAGGVEVSPVGELEIAER